MSLKAQIGAEGEENAANFLVKKGYTLLARNYRHKHAEIDIIASYAQILVFVEVKARKSIKYGHPEMAVDDKKAEKIREGAENYILEKNWLGRIRFDIIAVNTKNNSIDHFKDAF